MIKKFEYVVQFAFYTAMFIAGFILISGTVYGMIAGRLEHSEWGVYIFIALYGLMLMVCGAGLRHAERG
jgi:hypothetical protein